ncbi:hypothetical protein GDO81_016466 [Engystomops pustulosus]|uniref:Uncharacterized protein n=1 Tax=Engystomops pustulosus TaxID=76066 RepID=A0AAV7AS88_ENGPU|nr:hypothetical protein GDO81_016466 [Engystomops pustulosus]
MSCRSDSVNSASPLASSTGYVPFLVKIAHSHIPVLHKCNPSAGFPLYFSSRLLDFHKRLYLLYLPSSLCTLYVPSSLCTLYLPSSLSLQYYPIRHCPLPHQPLTLRQPPSTSHSPTAPINFSLRGGPFP